MKKTIIKISISVILFGIVLFNIDKNSLITNISKMNIAYIPLLIGFLVTNYLVSSVRWKKLLIHKDSHKVSVKYLAKLYFEGAFFNNFMPTSVGGDVYKIYKLGKKLGSTAHAFSSTFMERFTGVIALVLISYVGLFTALGTFISLFPTDITSNELLLTIVKVLLFAGFWVAAFAGFIGLKIISLRVNKIKKIYDALMEYRGRYAVLGWAFLTSFIVQFLAVFTQYFIFKALGVDLPLMYSLFVFPVITLASFFIPSLNGLGVQDTLYIQLFTLIGVNKELALSASILYHIFRLLVSLIGGVIYAFNKEN
ncbi:MAG: lysylphosphatidylglycerol synthase transmembrane domain-containing protein [Patescibacteria group bacterium]